MFKNAALLCLFVLLALCGYAQQGAQKDVGDSLLTGLKKDTLMQAAGNKTDSVQRVVKKREHQLDSAKGKLQHSIDSLDRLHLPTAKYTRQLDSLNKINPLKDIQQAQAKLTAPIQKVNTAVTQAEGKVTAQEQKATAALTQAESKLTAPAQKATGAVTQAENKVNSELNSLNKETGPGANLPGSVSMPNTNLPTAPGLGTNGAPNLSLPNANTTLPGVNNPIAGGNGELGSIEKSVSNITNAPKEGLTELKGVDEINKAEKEMGQVSQITQKASSYEKDIQNISKGDLQKVEQMPKTLESEAGKQVGIDQLKKETSAFEGYQKMATANDPEAMKKLAMQEVQKEAVNHFAGKEQQLQAAMNKVSQLKMKYPNLKSLADTLKKPVNPMHGKPLIERIVPGLTFQILKMNNRTWIDFNPWVGYRLTGRLTAGAGWNERFDIGFRHFHFTANHGIYGPRVFGDFKLRKGLSVRAELERMNTLIPPAQTSNGESHRQWVWGVFAGMKKDYKLFKSVKGNVQMLYNVYNLFGRHPKINVYSDQLAVRMGLEFPMKKKK